MNKFLKLSNIQAAILCQIKIQDIQYPLSDIAKSKEISNEKYQVRGRLCKDFQECFLQFQSSGFREVLYLSTFPLLVTAY